MTPRDLAEGIRQGRIGRPTVREILGVGNSRAKRLIAWCRSERFDEALREITELMGARVETPSSDPEHKAPPKRPAPKPILQGPHAGEPEVDVEEARARARQAYERTLAYEARRRRFEVRFQEGPVLLVFVGDQHIGSSGTDVERAFREAELVRQTPGAYAVLLGDVVDNFIVQHLLHLNARTPIMVLEQWELARSYLNAFGGKLIAAVSGNHDAWAYLLAGVDYLRSVLPDGVLYDREEMRLTVHVAGASYRIWARHRWRGGSIYNPTHAQERAARFNDARYDIYAGAHTHVGGMYREFVLHGQRKVAVQVGTYKIFDEYATQLGLPPHDHSTAVGVVLDGAGGMFGGASLRALCEYMRVIYSGR